MGVAAGYVVRFENDLAIYFAGDTGLFGDMRIIGEMYRPTIAFLPIGDVHTMGPEQAAKACELVGVTQIVPMHYGTVPGAHGYARAAARARRAARRTGAGAQAG